MNKLKITFNDNTSYMANIEIKSNYILLTYEYVTEDLLIESKFEKMSIDEILHCMRLCPNVKEIEVITNEK